MTKLSGFMDLRMMDSWNLSYKEQKSPISPMFTYAAELDV